MPEGTALLEEDWFCTSEHSVLLVDATDPPNGGWLSTSATLAAVFNHVPSYESTALYRPTRLKAKYMKQVQLADTQAGKALSLNLTLARLGPVNPVVP
jgi:hypothetical protein